MPQNNLQDAMEFLRRAVRQRLREAFSKEGREARIEEIPVPAFDREEDTPFTAFLLNNRLSREQLLLLLIALAPHIVPGFFDQLLSEFLPSGASFPGFGGTRPRNGGGLLPTGETALFILAGNELEARFRYQQYLAPSHMLAREKVLRLEPPPAGDPPMSGRLLVDDDYVNLFTQARIPLPQLSSRFPAQHLSTELEWDDLVLEEEHRSQIEDIRLWLEHREGLLYKWELYKRVKPGYLVLFHGPPGTGKTLTASLLGKYTQREVFKVDLSMVVSKDIGETEKNLASLFEKAQDKDWILFFDEADAIFSRRTYVRDANDKYANQEVSYLLQRVEQFSGLAILASNMKGNIDEAFMRRFDAAIFFPIPKAPERYKIWQKGIPANASLHPEVDLMNLARRYELSGAQIMNVIQHACLAALKNGKEEIGLESLERGIKKELAKEGKA